MGTTRRDFLRCTAGTGLVMLGGRHLLGCAPIAAPLVFGELVRDAASPRFGQVAVSLGTVADLQIVGGAVTVRVQNPPTDGSIDVPDGGVLLMRYAADRYVACAALCTHARCPLGYAPDQKLIVCPCHGSEFLPIAAVDKVAGTVTHPPAQGPLTMFDLEITPDTVWVDLNQATFPAVSDGVVALAVTDFPSLGSDGGSAIGRPRGLTDTLLVVRVSSSEVHVTSAICTHQKCKVGFDAVTQAIACPCHNSRFQLDGSVVSGPAPQPLKRYVATFDGSTVRITVS